MRWGFVRDTILINLGRPDLQLFVYFVLSSFLPTYLAPVGRVGIMKPNQIKSTQLYRGASFMSLLFLFYFIILLYIYIYIDIWVRIGSVYLYGLGTGGCFFFHFRHCCVEAGTCGLKPCESSRRNSLMRLSLRALQGRRRGSGVVA
ncbi:hypothetical protein GGS21DRAFT_88887 [Xylaria nigripes]|nr:hypothetical protein GGS21DRAFT_88887 [Xylaria nigripes]